MVVRNWRVALAFSLLAASTPLRAAEPAPVCTDDIYGKLCRGGAPAAPLTNADYGVIFVQVQSPPAITADAVKASKKSWKRWLKRYFVPSAKTGQIVLELTQTVAGQPVTLINMPVASFSIDEREGLRIETSQRFSSLAPATPFFRLNPLSNPITATFTFRSETVADSNIVQNAVSAAGLAADLGASGWLISTVAKPAITASLGQIENSIIKTAGSNVKAVTPVTVTFETDSFIDFNFGLGVNDPQKIGRVFIQLGRRPSLYTARVLANGNPDYGLRDRIDSGATNYLLTQQVSAGKTILQFVDEKSAGQLANFRSSSVTPAAFGAACTSIKQALNSPEYPIKPHDYMAVLWATWISGQNAKRANIKADPCINPEISGFKSYELKVP